jgi:hypothetical protein
MIKRDDWYRVQEKRRAYLYATEQGIVEVSFENVTYFRCSPGGTHFFEDDKGRKYIMQKGWLSIEIDGEWIDGHSH